MNEPLQRLLDGDPTAVLAEAASTRCPSVLVAAAVLTGDTAHLQRARALAVTARDRRLVVLAETRLRGDTDLLDALGRDHLAEHPDPLAAWITARRSTP